MSTLQEQVTALLAKVIDPEIGLPITSLGMVGEISGSEQKPIVEIKLTVSHCPQADHIQKEVTLALRNVFPEATVSMSVMSKEELDALKLSLRGPNRRNPFTEQSPTRVVLVGSGKGGVGKSTITANLAVSLAEAGYQVGLIDADIFGFSITTLLGIDERPTRLDDMILPPTKYGVKVVSIGMFVEGNEAISWRGPMLHKAIEQFLTDVYWGNLDFLLIDMPPGTGDVAISIGQLLPHAKALVVTTAQKSAATVAVRSGLAQAKAGHEIVGVVENMAWLQTETGNEMVLGSGGGKAASEELSTSIGTKVPLLTQIPISPDLSENADAGLPIVFSHPQDASARAITGLAHQIAEIKLSPKALKLQVKLT